MSREWIGSAGSVEEAVSLGLKKLRLTREQVHVDILEEKTSSLFSMMGFRRVRVRVRAKFEAPQQAPRRERPPQERRPSHGDRDRERDRDRDRSHERRHNGQPSHRHEGRGDRQSQEQQDRRNNQQRRGQDRDRRDFQRRHDSPRPPRQDRQDRPERPERPERREPPQERREPVETLTPAASSPQAPQPARPQGEPSLETFFSRPDAPAQPPATEGVPVNRSAENRPLTEKPNREKTMTPETLLAQWKGLMGWDDLEWTVLPVEGDRLPIALKSSQNSRLMGSGGETLESLEYLFNLVLERNADSPPRVMLKVEGYEHPRVQRIMDIARRAASEVKRSKRMYRLDPMPSAERRMVHQALANDPDVETFSEGEGPWRKVVVRPKQK